MFEFSQVQTSSFKYKSPQAQAHKHTCDDQAINANKMCHPDRMQYLACLQNQHCHFIEYSCCVSVTLFVRTQHHQICNVVAL